MKTKMINKITLAFSMVMMFSLMSFGQTVSLADINTAEPMLSVSVPLSLESLGEIGAISLIVNYDNSVMSFDGHSVSNPAAWGSTYMSTVSNETSPGVIVVSWFYIFGIVPVISAEEPFINLNFTFNECSSDVLFDEPLCEISDYTNVTPISGITYVNGSVSPLNPGPASTTWLASAIDNDWTNVANWDNGVPACGSDVIIAAAGSNFPIIPADKATVKINNLTIQSLGGITVLGSLDIAGDLVIEPSGSIIESGNVMVGGVTDFQIAGVSPTFQLFTPPVDYAQALSFLGQYVRTWNESTQEWENILAPSDILTAGVGYSLNSVTSQVFSMDQGSLISGDQSISGLTYTNGPNPLHDGFNLVGNPFASSVVFNATPSSWNLNNLDINAWVWDELFGNYRITGASLPGDVIPPAQGFFTRVLSAGTGSLTIPQVDRIHSGTPFYKEVKDEDNKLYLTVEGNNYGDKIAIILNNETTNGYDVGFDGYKLAGLEAAPQLYSVIENDVQLSKNAMPFTPSVGVHLEVGVDGSYTITANGMESFAANSTIDLEDLQTGVMTNLKEVNSYTFNASENDDAGRFMIHFGTLGIDNNLTEKIKVYSNQGRIHVSMSESLHGQVYIYNVIGQQVLSDITAGNSSFTVKSGVNYIVKVVTEETIITEKVFVK